MSSKAATSEQPGSQIRQNVVFSCAISGSPGGRATNQVVTIGNLAARPPLRAPRCEFGMIDPAPAAAGHQRMFFCAMASSAELADEIGGKSLPSSQSSKKICNGFGGTDLDCCR
ncbi:hypothetical protein ACFSTD_02310 [Novosphingobium colocasiae]